jgi:predicted RNA-binding protein with PIN domain
VPEFAMHILIDGYNLIRQSVSLRRFERQSLEAGRNALIASLSDYKKRKGHKITVVFDGWESGSALEERDFQADINIIYSSRGEKADEVIKRLTAESDEEIIVVSSDREISSFATRRGKTAISSPQFEMIMTKTINGPQTFEFEEVKDDEDEYGRPFKKKGQAHRLSRAQRNAQTKIKKL